MLYSKEVSSLGKKSPNQRGSPVQGGISLDLSNKEEERRFGFCRFTRFCLSQMTFSGRRDTMCPKRYIKNEHL